MGEQFSNTWDPRSQTLPLDQSYSGLFGGRFGKLGIVATFRHAQSSKYTEEERTFYKVGGGGAIEPFNGPYDFETTEQSGTVGGVGNIAYQFTPNQRLSFDNFYTHVGTNETRRFEGYNDDAGNHIRNQRLWWVEEQIASHHIGGDHLFPALSNSRLDWKIALSSADREEPDLREVLYESDPARRAFVLADESQSGLRQFNDLDDDTLEGSANWSTLFEQWNGLASQVKFGGNYIDRSRDFQSRRLRFVPRNIVTGVTGAVSGRSIQQRLGYARRNVTRVDLSLPAEQIFTAGNIGEALRAQGGNAWDRPVRRGANGHVLLRHGRPAPVGFDAPRDRCARRAVPTGRGDAGSLRGHHRPADGRHSARRARRDQPLPGGQPRPLGTPRPERPTRVTVRRSTVPSSGKFRRSSSRTSSAAGPSSATPT